MTIALQEDSPSLRTIMRNVLAKNERSFTDRFVLLEATLIDGAADAILALAIQTKPVALLLADPRLTPDVLLDLLPRLPAPQPVQIVLYGRLLELWHNALTPVEHLLADLDYEPASGFDPNIARFFALRDT